MSVSQVMQRFSPVHHLKRLHRRLILLLHLHHLSGHQQLEMHHLAESTSVQRLLMETHINEHYCSPSPIFRLHHLPSYCWHLFQLMLVSICTRQFWFTIVILVAYAHCIDYCCHASN